jgi:selenocysteine-specific elongation factor
MMISHILGTAGHIDHGKSALIRALTGVDPDRLPEEKRRGVTIELGFAQLTLPNNTSLGVVDVPGHEKFVRQMVAGASGVDIALLVVAVDDGVMVQTREHVRVLRLMGVRHIVVALSKADLADEEWRSLVELEVTELLEQHDFEDFLIIPTSVMTGEGIEELKLALEEVVNRIDIAVSSDVMRLPVDRSFTIEGAGCVVTGTLWSGEARVGDTVELLPLKRSARIRGIQVHGAASDVAHAGQRVALNLANIAASDIARGETVATPGTLSMTNRFDAILTYLGPDAGVAVLESGARVHVHHGATTTLGRVLLFGEEALAPGTEAFVQIRLESPVAMRYGDRFIIRSYSPTFTVGGGTILVPQAIRRATLGEGEYELLTALAERDLRNTVLGMMNMTNAPHTSAELAVQLGTLRSQVAAILNQADFERIKIDKETSFITSAGASAIRNAINSTLLAFHEANPQETDMSIATLREQAVPNLSPILFDAFVMQLIDQKIMTVNTGRVRHNHAAQTARIEQEELAAKALPLLINQGLSPDSLADLSSRLKSSEKTMRSALAPLVADDKLVRLAGDLYFAPEAIEQGAACIRQHLTAQSNGSTAAQLRDVLGVSRKYAIPLLEHYDRIALTRRDGDLRFLK